MRRRAPSLLGFGGFADLSSPTDSDLDPNRAEDLDDEGGGGDDADHHSTKRLAFWAELGEAFKGGNG